MIIKEKLVKLNKFEPYFFYLFLLINLLPVFSFKLFPTVDGPAHLYNSKLIIELLKDPTSVLHDFFVFNQNINPNWSGHLLLSLFMLILPGFIAEKIVLLMYLIGLPLSIRYLFKILLIENKYLVYMIFPFTYSFLFYYGFYNFNIGLVLFILGISFWLKFQNNFNVRKILILTILSTLICFSHLFVFALFLLIVFVINIQNALISKSFESSARAKYIKQILLQFFALLPGIIIMLNFISTQSQNEPSVYLKHNEIFKLIMEISPAKGINYGKANIFTQWILYVFVSYLIYLIANYFYSLRHKKKNLIIDKLWLIVSIITLILIFIMPDSKGAAVGFVTSRLILFFFIFLIICLASLDVKYWFKLVVFIIVNYVNIAFVVHNYKSITKGCKIAEELRTSSEFINANCTVLPIINSDYFLFNHISNYIGIDKPMIILENYEASLNHFPLKWNNKQMPKLMLGNISAGSICKDWASSDKRECIIDYVVILNAENQVTDSICYEKINSCLNTYYELIYSKTDGAIKIFRKKQ